MDNTPLAKHNEIQLTDAFGLVLEEEHIYAQLIKGKRYDIDSKSNYLKTNIEYAIERDEYSQPLLSFLKELIASHEAKHPSAQKKR